ncbi:hypothetical protein Hanom_Chr01g00010341 [Helianthus anomalus]
MEKAINRQKILLQHLQPVSSSSSSYHKSNLFKDSRREEDFVRKI